MPIAEIEPGPTSGKSAPLWLAAVAVMARNQKYRVISVDTAGRNGLGSIRLSRPLISDYDRKYYRFGYRKAHTQIERAIIVVIAGAVALDLETDGRMKFAADPGAAAAIEILEDVDWWRSEARSHLDLLRHRATRLLARPKEWRSVIAVASVLRGQSTIKELELRKMIAKAVESKQVEGCEHFVVIQRDSPLPSTSKSKTSKRADSLKRQHVSPGLAAVPTDTAPRHDGVVTHEILRRVIATVREPSTNIELCTRLRQTEPDLFRAIEQAADAGIQSLELDMHDPKRHLATAAIARCGLIVAEALQQGHAALWATTIED